MKIKLSLKLFICNIIFYFPVLYMLLYMINDGLARNLVQILLILLVCAELKLILSNSCNNIKVNLIYSIYLFFIIIIEVILWGYYYLFNLDFYGYILLLFLFIVFSDKSYLECMHNIIINKNKFKKLIFAFYFLLIFSILFMHGLQVNDTWGISLPVLYGPFEIPHGLSYTMIILYCLASVHLHRTGKKVYLALMIIAAICSVWTGVRSGVLALGIVILSDYFSIRNVSKKFIIGGGIICVLVYLALFTDILSNNPIMQKTNNAISRGTISNGREMFSNYLMNFYVNIFSLFQKLFGISITGIRELMYIRWGTNIHAHNDFINILMGYGIIGFVPFIYGLIRLCRQAPKYIYLLLVLGVLAYYNGLFMYVGFSPCIPILVNFYREIYSKTQNEITVATKV